MLNLPNIPSDAFAGQRGITEGTQKSGIGHLAQLLQNIKSDLLSGDAGLSGSGVTSAPSQVVKAALPGGADLVLDIDIPSGIQLEVVDCKAVMKGAGAASDTVQVQKFPLGGPATNITNALDLSAADLAIVRAAQIDDANNVLDGDVTDKLRIEHLDNLGDDMPPVDLYIEIRVL